MINVQVRSKNENSKEWRHNAEKETVQHILDAMHCIALIVNPENRIMFCNQYTSEMFGIQNQQTIQGLHPGELIFCNYANKGAGTCGGTKNCRYCELLTIIEESRNGNCKVSRECRILAAPDNPVLSYDLQVQAAPLQIEYNKYILISMIDISHEKRRRNLERIFFHDLINIAGGLKGLVDFYCEEQDPELLQNIFKVSQTILEEIYAQRDLAAAENGELQVSYSPVNSLELLQQVGNSLQHHTAAIDKKISIDTGSETKVFYTDARILKRILLNMLKNGLEASSNGETVTLGCKNKSSSMEFWVHNPAVMPEDVQAQVFQRSFSTKGNDRGLGTYSMRLLTERYLKGIISFDSTPSLGTTFRIFFPNEHLQ